MLQKKKYVFLGVITLVVWLFIFLLSSNGYKKWVYEQEIHKAEKIINQQVEYISRLNQVDFKTLKSYHNQNNNVNFFVKENS